MARKRKTRKVPPGAAARSVQKPPAAQDPAALNLEQVRAQIDSIDEKIHGLINDRARLAQLVGISKTREGKTVDFYRPPYQWT